MIEQIRIMNNPPFLSSARWICSSACGGPRTSAPAPYFRKAFHLDAPVKSAVLHISALGLYDAELNGKAAHEDTFAPGWTDYRKRVQFRSYEIAGLLQEGENVIGVILGDGWYCGKVAWWNRQNYGDRPKLLAALEVELTNGAKLLINTDDSWKSCTGPILENDLVMGETYDARRELGPWSQPGYDDSTWQPALMPEQPRMAISIAPGPPVRRQEILPGKSLREKASSASHHRFDFGQNLSGRLRIAVRGQPGLTIELRHAEMLKPDESLYLENLRSARATDIYTCRSDVPETWEPRFTFHGFRYADVSARDAQFECSAEAVVLHSDTPRTGYFACSHPLLNQLYQNTVWGQKGNFLEVPTDCPQRDERLGWTGDAQVFIRTAAFNMDVRGFFHKWLRDMRDAQSIDGKIPAVIPTLSDFVIDGGPAWADAAIICPWTLYLCYEDLEILRDNYDCMGAFIRSIEKAPGTHDYIRVHRDFEQSGGFGDWLALDGSGLTEGGTPKDLIGTAFFAQDAALMAKIATLLDKGDDALHYQELHRHIVKAFRRRFVSADGLLAAGTQTSYVLALHFDLLPEELRPAATRELVRDIEKRQDHLATGFVGTPYLLNVLEKNGRLDMAYRLLEQETFPSWLFPVKNGATTIWERWDGWTKEKGFQTPDMNSFNHYAYGAVGAWMVSSVAGLELSEAEPGYRSIVFRPRPGGTLTWAEAELQTPQGRARIRWDLQDKALQIELIVPEGARATLDLIPEYGGQYQRAWSTGTHALTVRRP